MSPIMSLMLLLLLLGSDLIDLSGLEIRALQVSTEEPRLQRPGAKPQMPVRALEVEVFMMYFDYDLKVVTLALCQPHPLGCGISLITVGKFM